MLVVLQKDNAESLQVRGRGRSGNGSRSTETRREGKRLHPACTKPLR
ncbi:MAG: hypothetical protein OJF61_002524 [Rhodanobacteraceae bacterium]|nr:MAG: hypothetical protein OJF61_002524 [Rhodanobacteraceae bacterium]